MDKPTQSARQEASTELAARLAEKLPEAWRNETSLTLWPDSLVLHFRDAQGHRHAFDIRRMRLGAKTFVAGEALAYGYLRVDDAVDDEAMLDEYRAALRSVAGAEADILPWLQPGSPEHPSFADLVPASPQLAAALTELLPKAWRNEASVDLSSTGFVLRTRDAMGRQHAFDARWPRAGESAFVAGEALAYGYLRVDDEVRDEHFLQEYRDVLTAIAARERDFLPLLAAQVEPLAAAAPVDASLAVAPVIEIPAPEELTALVGHVLPPAWRNEVRVALAPPGGLVVHFRDSIGRRHALDVRPKRPDTAAFVAGESLAYSYLHVDDAVDEAALLEDYRAALTELAARERDLLPWLQEAPPSNWVADAPEMLPVLASEPTNASLTALLTPLLPEPWRRDVAVVLWPTGYVVRFSDQEGHRHAFDARWFRPGDPAFVAGESFAYGYLRVDDAVDEAAVLEDYRAALTKLAAEEQQILPVLNEQIEALTAATATATATTVGPETNEATEDFGTVTRADESPAPPELTALLAALLPPAWRHEVRAALAPPGGMVLHFRDAQGHRHAVDARPRRPEASSFVAGETLTYSYLHVDDAVDEVELLEDYRAALTAVAARERDLLPWLAEAPAADPAAVESEALEDSAGDPTNAALTALLTPLLPERWRHGVSVVLWPSGFALHFRGDDGRRRAFDIRWARPGEPAFVTGGALAYGYLRVDDTVDEPAELENYRAVLTGMASHERELLPLLAKPEDSSAPSTEGASPSPLLARTDEHPAPPELTALLVPLLPAEWQHEARAALAPPGGLVLHFRDGQGREHAFDVRPRQPNASAFVEGESLAYSYLYVDGAVDEPALQVKYRAALSAIAKHEPALLPWLRDTATPTEVEPSSLLPFVAGDAVASLADLLAGLLPERWRREVELVLWSTGFTLNFRDERGRRHTFDVRTTRPGDPAFVAGESLAYSYLRADDEAVEAAVIREYRATLTRFAAHERELLRLYPQLAAPAEG